MKSYNKIFPALLFAATLSCKKTELPITTPISDAIVLTNELINKNEFAGIGVQWGGYDNVPKWTGAASLSGADWNTLFKRVSFLRPNLVRIMTGPGWNYMTDGNFTPEKSKDILFKILDYCQAQKIDVLYGEWGEQPVDGKPNGEWLKNSVRFLDYLINTKQYSCIKYLNMLNEPAGEWSSTGGSYDLWQAHYDQLLPLLQEKNLLSKIKVMAPDIAVWGDNSLLDWITKPQERYGTKLGAFDIHTYPSED